MADQIESSNDIKKIETDWKSFLPRKIAGAVISMYLVGSAAQELKELPNYKFYMVIGCMSIISLAGIWTHYLLERGAKSKQVKQGETDGK